MVYTDTLSLSLALLKSDDIRFYIMINLIRNWCCYIKYDYRFRISSFENQLNDALEEGKA